MNGRIKVEATLEEVVVIRFSDNGAGIPPDILLKIFDRFYTTRGENSDIRRGLAFIAPLHDVQGPWRQIIDVASKWETGDDLYHPALNSLSMFTESLNSSVPWNTVMSGV